MSDSGKAYRDTVRSVAKVREARLAEALAENERLRAQIETARLALAACGSNYSTRPGTVASASAEIAGEFQRRMEVAYEALVALSSTEDKSA